MKPFPACYRAARYRAANCRRGFPSFLNGERRVAKRKAKGFSHERTNFIHSRWTVSWKDNRARTRASASSFADSEPLIASSRSPKLLFARLFFLFSLLSSPFFQRVTPRINEAGSRCAASPSNGTSTSWLQRPLECVYTFESSLIFPFARNYARCANSIPFVSSRNEILRCGRI